jgi:hypothetical protein
VEFSIVASSLRFLSGFMPDLFFTLNTSQPDTSAASEDIFHKSMFDQV